MAGNTRFLLLSTSALALASGSCAAPERHARAPDRGCVDHLRDVEPPPPIDLPETSAEPVHCEAGQRRVARFPGAPPAVERAHAGPGCRDAGCWAWAGVGVSRELRGAGARLTVHAPRPAPGGHSLAQVAVAGAGPARDAVEIGWRVSPPLEGDGRPRLFVHRWIDGAPCWQDCRWHGWSGRWAPGDAVDALVGQAVSIAVVEHQGRWWFWFDGEWLGWFDAADWRGRLEVATSAQWFGEVFTAEPPVRGEMGSGERPDDSHAARFVTTCQVFPGTWSCRPGAFAFPHASLPTVYGLGPPEGDGFRYGGRR